jgi:DNA-binding NtrC family response regulator
LSHQCEANPLPRIILDPSIKNSKLERRLIEDALRECSGNKQKAAQTLGLSRHGLTKKMKRLAIRAKAESNG